MKFEIIINWLSTVNIFELIKRFYGNLIDLIGFIVDKTSEQGADIAIRALPIVSPLPNAISMYYVSQTVLRFTDLQAKAFAIAMELALFGLFEVVLNQFDGWQRDPKRYTITLRLAASIAVGVMLLIIIVVWRVETDRPILATLPLFSAAGAAALTLRRWHNHNEVAEVEKFTETIQALNSVQIQLNLERNEFGTKLERLNAERLFEIERLNDERDNERFLEQERINQLEQTLNELRIENAVLMERSSAKNTIVPGVEANNKPSETDTDKRRTIVLDFYRNNPGVPYQAAADALGVPKTSVYNDVKFWEKRGTVHVNGNGVEVLK